MKESLKMANSMEKVRKEDKRKRTRRKY